MGNEFLLFITRDRAPSLLLSAVLDNVNLMCIFYILFLLLILTTKIQNNYGRNKNNYLKVILIKTIFVISQSQKHGFYNKNIILDKWK